MLVNTLNIGDSHAPLLVVITWLVGLHHGDRCLVVGVGHVAPGILIICLYSLGIFVQDDREAWILSCSGNVARAILFLRNVRKLKDK